MSNFGARLAYPTPDWVAYRRPDPDEMTPSTPGETTSASRRETIYRPSGRTRRLAFLAALRRFAHAWARSQVYNSFV